jgi:hypothetical protein
MAEPFKICLVGKIPRPVLLYMQKRLILLVTSFEEFYVVLMELCNRHPSKILSRGNQGNSNG